MLDESAYKFPSHKAVLVSKISKSFLWQNFSVLHWLTHEMHWMLQTLPQSLTTNAKK